jgi:hypothetical protein
LQDQVVLALFAMPNEVGFLDQAQEYLKMWREEDMNRLQDYISENKAKEL